MSNIWNLGMSPYLEERIFADFKSKILRKLLTLSPVLEMYLWTTIPMLTALSRMQFCESKVFLRPPGQ